MPLPPKEPAGTAGTILLVEEYDALAAAFGSALRRLAPNYQTFVARSLAEAETVAAEKRPDLCVIDFDPPQRGAMAFFNRLKAAHGRARALIIAATTWPELSRARIRPGAFHFIEKPFELPKLDAALRVLLPFGGDPIASPSVGALEDFDLTDAVALCGATGASTILHVTATSGSTGAIYFSSGQITQAATAGKAGTAALEEMLRWRSPRFAEEELRDPAPRTIRGRWTTVLETALETVGKIEEAASREREQQPANPTPPEKTIVVIDDTELLLVFVEDVLRTARPPSKIVTATTGLDGLRRTAETLPDLVLLDYSLPDIAGDEVCRRLLENERTARIPVIMMSGHIAEMAATAESFANVVATIGKPFLSAALLGLVEETLANLPRLEIPAQKDPAPPSREPDGKGERVAAEESSPPPPSPAPAETVEEPQRAPPEVTAAPISADSLPEQTPSPEISPNESSPAVEDGLTEVPAMLETQEPPAQSPAPPPPSEPVTAAKIPQAKNNTVILALPLEITAMQFSSSLELRAIRAKPNSPLVSVHILPGENSSAEVVARNFELERVDLDIRGHIHTVHLAPSAVPATLPVGGKSLSIADLEASPGEENGSWQLLADAAATMPVHLLTLFELVSVELAAGFSVGRLVLKTRGAKVRVKLLHETVRTGITFRSAQILLDHSAQIADVLMDALA